MVEIVDNTQPVIDPKPYVGRTISRFLPQLGGPRQNVAIRFGTEKLEWQKLNILLTS